MSKIAIITARGGSKRIPRKNIKTFCGRPIIEYSIEAALQAGIFDEVMVSTDDEEIAKIAERAGASVPFMRSERTAHDYANTADVILEVLEKYGSMGKSFDQIACLYPTAPFVTAVRLREAMELLQKKQADMIMPVVKFSFPPQRGVILKDGRLAYKWPENRNLRSQDLEPIYHDCGQFYCYDAKAFAEVLGQFQEGIFPIIIPETEVQDIDTIDDWKIAEVKYRLLSDRMGEQL